MLAHAASLELCPTHEAPPKNSFARGEREGAGPPRAKGALYTGMNVVSTYVGYNSHQPEHTVKMPGSLCCGLPSFERSCPPGLIETIPVDEFLEIIDALNGLMKKYRKYYAALALLPLVPAIIGICFLAKPKTAGVEPAFPSATYDYEWEEYWKREDEDQRNAIIGWSVLVSGVILGSIVAWAGFRWLTASEMKRVHLQVDQLNSNGQYKDRLTFQFLEYVRELIVLCPSSATADGSSYPSATAYLHEPYAVMADAESPEIVLAMPVNDNMEPSAPIKPSY